MIEPHYETWFWNLIKIIKSVVLLSHNGMKGWNELHIHCMAIATVYRHLMWLKNPVTSHVFVRSSTYRFTVLCHVTTLFFTCRWFGPRVSAIFLRKVFGLIWSGVSARQVGRTGAAHVTTVCQHHVQLHWDVEVNIHTSVFVLSNFKSSDLWLLRHCVLCSWNDLRWFNCHLQYICETAGGRAALLLL